MAHFRVEENLLHELRHPGHAALAEAHCQIMLELALLSGLSCRLFTCREMTMGPANRLLFGQRHEQLCQLLLHRARPHLLQL